MQNNKELTLKELIIKKREKSKKVDTKLIIKSYDYARKKLKDKQRENRRKIFESCIRCCIYISRSWAR